MQRFDGHSIIVTGAAQGMGRAIAEAFVAEGGHVTLADVQEQRVADAAAALAGGPGSATAVVCDVTKAGDIEAMVAGVLDREGKIDHLVNNAGVISMGRCVELAEDDWDRIMEVNAKGVFLCMRAVLPHMLERRSGSIVNLGSQAGKRGTPLLPHYCASKAAVHLLSKTVALEVAPDVRVNCVCPGVVETELLEREFAWTTALTGETEAEIRERWSAVVPMKRFQQPEDIARVVLFLSSEDAAHMTGQAINVDGGLITEL
jgi:NAD(P)-dependent dehydrogenase (short-subunit alcohol dehydrogenase family)